MPLSKILIGRVKSIFQTNCIQNMSVNLKDTEDSLLEASRKLVPSLSTAKHKGQDGRIGIVGGSLEYSGAPYLAGMSALRTGADLVHIFCCKEASTPIKSYSPELIVHPVLNDSNALNLIIPWLERLHVVLIGPGLGRDPTVFENVSKLITACARLSKPLVIDADGLFLVSQNPNLIKNYPGVVLTPNSIEFTRLVEAFLNKTIQPAPIASDVLIKQLAQAIGPHAIVVSKGAEDKIGDGETDTTTISCAAQGSGRRCGGQGDLLAGSLSVFKCWSLKSTQPQASNLACYAACRLVRETNKSAFLIKHRGMLASDMIDQVAITFAKFFEPDV